jgi:hypothetical protein
VNPRRIRIAFAFALCPLLVATLVTSVLAGVRHESWLVVLLDLVLLGLSWVSGVACWMVHRVKTAPSAVAVGCRDCGWLHQVTSTNQIGPAMALHNTECPGKNS